MPADLSIPASRSKSLMDYGTQIQDCINCPDCEVVTKETQTDTGFVRERQITPCSIHA